ncbi:MAG: hypothetical protein Q9218_004168 [Villophora microphyllina]
MNHGLRYPEPTAQPIIRNIQNHAPPHQAFPRTSSGPDTAGLYQARGSPDRLSISAASAASHRGRRGSRTSSRQNHHGENAPTRHSVEQQLPHTPEHYIGSKEPSFVDPEKTNFVPNSASSGFRSNHAHSTYVSEEEDDIENHTVWILGRPSQIYLSFLLPIMATFISIYTILTTLILLLLSPLSLCCKTFQPLGHQFRKFLTPPIDLQLGLVFSARESNSTDSDKSNEETRNDHSVFLLILINVLSPVYAAGIAVTAWVAAGFWFTALILGNPDGRDGRDDGRAVVMGVKNLWEKWLKKGLR